MQKGVRVFQTLALLLVRVLCLTDMLETTRNRLLSLEDIQDTSSSPSQHQFQNTVFHSSIKYLPTELKSPQVDSIIHELTIVVIKHLRVLVWSNSLITVAQVIIFGAKRQSRYSLPMVLLTIVAQTYVLT